MKPEDGINALLAIAKAMPESFLIDDVVRKLEEYKKTPGESARVNCIISLHVILTALTTQKQSLKQVFDDMEHVKNSYDLYNKLKGGN